MKIYVHGGVSGVAKKEDASLAAGIAAGERCASSLDAVETAVARLEDDPALNAGYGAALNYEGRLELDAGIVDGEGGRTGAVSGVTVRNPVRLARRVMEDTPHVLMTGAGATALARQFALEEMTQSTPEQHERWRRARDEGRLSSADFARPEHVDTVGAVAIDGAGRLAAASSTGGVFGQLAGRVGDAPLFGAGFFASRGTAVVGTGVGELFIETLACRRASELAERGVALGDACAAVIQEMARRRPGIAAGLLALDADGEVATAFTGAAWRVEGQEGVVKPYEVAGA